MPELYEVMKIDNGWQLLGLILGFAAVIMAMLQILNELLPTRAGFQWAWLRIWIKQRARQYERAMQIYRADQATKRGKEGQEDQTDVQSEEKAPDGPAEEQGDEKKPDIDLHLPQQDVGQRSREAYVLLVASATGGHRLAFLGLPTNQFVGQISAASQIALQYPNQYFSLLSVLAQPTLPGLDRFWWGPQLTLQASTHLKDLEILWDFAEKNDPLPPKVATGERQPLTQKELDARNRIGHAIQRNLDGMQIELTNQSGVWTKVFAIVIGAVIAWLAWRTAQKPLEPASGPSQLSIWYALLIGVSAGYAASVLDDIVNTIRRLGQR